MSGGSLVEFLLARIAEDEAVARDLIAEGPWSGFHGDDMSGPTRDEEYSGLNIGAGRVLADCKAKRRIVEEHAPDDVDPCTSADHMGHLSPANECPMFRELAAVYADHPDYREVWRP